uniref:Uncharacterized protein n=1 Tax=Arundo donax TaxID=35708 RepID=A0A0A9ATZ4_ARUDO
MASKGAPAARRITCPCPSATFSPSWRPSPRRQRRGRRRRISSSSSSSSLGSIKVVWKRLPTPVGLKMHSKAMKKCLRM